MECGFTSRTKAKVTGSSKQGEPVIPERKPCPNCKGGTIESDRYACPVCGDVGSVLIPDSVRLNMAVKRIKSAEAKVADQAATIERLTAERDDARAANECDRTALHRVVHEIDSEIKGRMWLIEGRGPYEWDDDRYRQEFGWAVQALETKLEVLRRIAGDLKNCPTNQAGVAAALSKQVQP